jgi:HSP20 family protein
MAQSAAKLPVTTEKSEVTAGEERIPFESFRREVERLFEDFRPFSWVAPSLLRPGEFGFSKSKPGWPLNPAFDVVEKEKAYEIAAELPGVDEKTIEVKLNNRLLTIKGQKREEKTENNSNYHLSERRFGSFQRSFQLPDGVDDQKIEATFAKGVLTVRLPKTVEAQNAERTISVQSA